MSQWDNRENQLWLWGAMGSLTLFAHAGGGYLLGMITGAAILLVTKGMGKSSGTMPKTLAWVEWAWLGAVLGSILPHGAFYWPGTGGTWAVGLTLLALSLGIRGLEPGLRWASTLFWPMVALGLIVAAKALGNVEATWLQPEMGRDGGMMALAWALPGVLPWILPQEKERKGKHLALGGAGVALAALIQGNLSLGVAEDVDGPWYVMAQGLGHGGVELIAAVGATLGWFGLTALLLEAGAKCAAQGGWKEREGKILLAAVAAGMVLGGVRLPGEILGLGSVMAWLVIPNLLSEK